MVPGVNVVELAGLAGLLVLVDILARLATHITHSVCLIKFDWVGSMNSLLAASVADRSASYIFYLYNNKVANTIVYKI